MTNVDIIGRRIGLGVAGLLLVLIFGLMGTTASAEMMGVPGADAVGAVGATATAPFGALLAAGGSAPQVAWYWMIPFALLLGSIAICPLINMHFWEHNYPWFAIILGTIVGVYYLFFFNDPGAVGAWLHEMQEYVSFIALLGALYIVSGGIVINVSKKSTPMVNTSILAIGAVIANIFGTTGAAMLLIRPFIRINKNNIKPYHIVFFIFIVANCGGSLTPIGDPPLFMGYLKGIPFFWVLMKLWPMWLMVCLVLLAVFYVIDSKNAKATPRDDIEHEGPAVTMTGIHNFGFVVLILIGVFQESMFHMIKEGHYLLLPVSREIMMGAAAGLSLIFTNKKIYDHNEFNYEPIKEVAILFIGIFSTMVPALNYLNNHSEQMPLKTAGQYYFITGGLSGVLDNAPTYLVFLETKRGNITKKYTREIATLTNAVELARETGQPITEIDTTDLYNRQTIEGEEVSGEVAEASIAKVDAALKQMKKDYPELFNKDNAVAPGKIEERAALSMLTGTPELSLYLIAISIGAVFFGACTYIGNGPNFMVKSIAESTGITMPSFFGYFLKYALPVLIPIYIVVWLVFISGWVV